MKQQVPIKRRLWTRSRRNHTLSCNDIRSYFRSFVVEDCPEYTCSVVKYGFIVKMKVLGDAYWFFRDVITIEADVCGIESVEVWAFNHIELDRNTMLYIRPEYYGNYIKLME